MGYPVLNGNPGANLIESAALFEAGVASLISSESDLLDKLIQRNEDAGTLIDLNEQILSIICCLKELERAVVKLVQS